METFSVLLAICAGNSPVPHKGQWRWVLMFSLICARIKDWVNNGDAVDLRRHRAHYDVTVMWRYAIGDYILQALLTEVAFIHKHNFRWCVIGGTSRHVRWSSKIVIGYKMKAKKKWYDRDIQIWFIVILRQIDNRLRQMNQFAKEIPFTLRQDDTNH